jgi:hypothetical protein
MTTDPMSMIMAKQTMAHTSMAAESPRKALWEDMLSSQVTHPTTTGRKYIYATKHNTAHLIASMSVSLCTARAKKPESSKRPLHPTATGSQSVTVTMPASSR